MVAVIESMKMHWEIRAPVGGTLADIGARAGDAVAAGALLLRVELREDTGRASE